MIGECILSKKVKPLIILQGNETLKSEELQQLANAATKAFTDGCLIIDSRVNIIAFDDRGRLVYPIKTSD